METAIWLIFMIPTSLLFTGIGIYAWKSKKPMWFWSGSTVSEREISDIPAYNRANGIMWLSYSAVFWISAVLGIFKMDLAGAFLAIGCLGGIPVLIVVYRKIYDKYRKK
ncbi:MAG: hypothetical protein II135_04595 [Clostridia bacterium]|nr:hypothetical protein [Clostridia bacterium]MBQ1847265.1 hypothetical protein [Clostridia bacterium]